jgi:hypothetical protein
VKRIMKHPPVQKIVTDAPEFWMFVDAQRLTCPECKDSSVYGIDQVHYEPGLLICTGVEELEEVENTEGVPW